MNIDGLDFTNRYKFVFKKLVVVKSLLNPLLLNNILYLYVI